jgi:ribosomal protein L5
LNVFALASLVAATEHDNDVVSVFPEINLDKVEYRQGMNITFVTSARNDAHARHLLALLGIFGGERD